MNDYRLNCIKEFNDSIFSMESIKKKDNLIFIYTPPKVGSTTLVTSLRISCAREVNVLHIHDENMLSIITGIKNDNKVTVIDLINYNSSIGKNVFVIDVYRNPIERKISEYFELITTYHFNTSDTNLVNYKLELLIKRFNSLFPFLGIGDYFFDKYEIDIPEHFDFENKYLLVEKNNIKYIKLRLCDSNEWGKILSMILKMDIVIVKDYQTENKVISEVYKKFNEMYQVPYNLLETVIQCRFFNYYNTEIEKQNYLNIWNSKKDMTIFEPFSLEKYNYYKEISSENQFLNVIQRDHYLDHGCICNSCFYKRKQIFLKIKNGEHLNNTKIIHEEVVQEKKIRKVQRIGNICNKIQNKLNEMSKKRRISENSKIIMSVMAQ